MVSEEAEIQVTLEPTEYIVYSGSLHNPTFTVQYSNSWMCNYHVTYYISVDVLYIYSIDIPYNYLLKRTMI